MTRPPDEGFYRALRETVVVLCCGLALFVASLAAVAQWTARARRAAARPRGDPRLETPRVGPASPADPDVPPLLSIVYMVAAWAVASIAAVVLLVPATVVAHEAMPLLASSAHWLWLDAMLLDKLWAAALASCIAVLYVGLPFAYFYCETDPGLSFFGRARETATTLALVYAIMGSTLAVLVLLAGETGSSAAARAPQAATVGSGAPWLSWRELVSAIGAWLMSGTTGADGRRLYTPTLFRSVLSEWLGNGGPAGLLWPLCVVAEAPALASSITCVSMGLARALSWVRQLPVSLSYAARLRQQLELGELELEACRAKLQLLDASGQDSGTAGVSSAFERSGAASVQVRPAAAGTASLARTLQRHELVCAIEKTEANQRLCAQRLRFSSPWLRNGLFLVSGLALVGVWAATLYAVTATMLGTALDLLAEWARAPEWLAVLLRADAPTVRGALRQVPMALRALPAVERWRRLLLAVSVVLHVIVVSGFLALMALGAVWSLGLVAPAGDAPPTATTPAWRAVPQPTPLRTPLFRRMLGLSGPVRGGAADRDSLRADDASKTERSRATPLTVQRLLGALFLLVALAMAAPVLVDPVLGLASLRLNAPTDAPIGGLRPGFPASVWLVQLYRLAVVLALGWRGLLEGLTPGSSLRQ